MEGSHKFIDNITANEGQVKHPLKYYKEKDMEMFYTEDNLKPNIEEEIKKGFFQVSKKSL